MYLSGGLGRRNRQREGKGRQAAYWKVSLDVRKRTARREKQRRSHREAPTTLVRAASFRLQMYRCPTTDHYTPASPPRPPSTHYRPYHPFSALLVCLFDALRKTPRSLLTFFGESALSEFDYSLARVIVTDGLSVYLRLSYDHQVWSAEPEGYICSPYKVPSGSCRLLSKCHNTPPTAR